jgi:hypothetical protein
VSPASGLRWLVIVTLAAALGVGLWLMPGESATATTAAFDAAQEEDALNERFARYVGLRMVDDHEGLYEMVDPVEREDFPKAAYLMKYGQGVMKFHALDLLGLDVVAEERSATLTVRTDAELLPHRFPPRYRAGFRMPDHPEDLRSVKEHPMPWVWRDGEWYFRLDQAKDQASLEEL